MIIANTGDWHLRGKDLDAARAQLLEMTRECRARGVTLVTIAGDVFDRDNIGDNHVRTGGVEEVGIEAITALTDGGIEVLMILGNHDIAGVGSADALHCFDNRPLVSIVREPRVVELTDGLFMACAPWSWAGGDAEAAITALMPFNALLAHVQVTGARMSGAFTCEAKPGAWQVSRAFLEDIPAVRHIALGDFHARQNLAGGRGGYVGALRQLNFGEEGNPAGFELWDSETGAVEWVELSAAPRYRTITVPAGQTCAAVEPSDAERLRYRFEGGPPDPVLVAELENAGYSVESIVTAVERVRRAEVPAGIASNPHAMIDLFASVAEPPIGAERLAGMHRAHDRVFSDKREVAA